MPGRGWLLVAGLGLLGAAWVFGGDWAQQRRTFRDPAWTAAHDTCHTLYRAAPTSRDSLHVDYYQPALLPPTGRRPAGDPALTCGARRRRGEL